MAEMTIILKKKMQKTKNEVSLRIDFQSLIKSMVIS